MDSTTLRIRVQTIPPLQPLKVWHVVSLNSSIEYIRDLTVDIARVLNLQEAGNLSLELDGFELLPSSPVGVVRDGDIVNLKYEPNAGGSEAPTGRTLLVSGSSEPRRKKQKTEPPVAKPMVMPVFTTNRVASSKPTTPVLITSRPITATSRPQAASSSSESTDSSDESSSDSTSDSESTSGSDSSSSEESDGPPQPQPISRRVVTVAKVNRPDSNTPRLPQTIRAVQPPVPPGQGKQSTKDRNARRRKLLKHQAAGTAIIPSDPSRTSSTPASVDAPPDVSGTSTQIKPKAPIASAKNANRNKRPGFDQSMAAGVATRTVFSEPIDSAAQTRVTTPPSKSRYTHYHVVPPSQLTNLPSNVIVTSVDVEAVDGMDGVGEWFGGEARGRDIDEPMKTRDDTDLSKQKVDWRLVDSEWRSKSDTYETVGIDGCKKLRAGMMLGWEDLTIDPDTFEPCVRVHLARVVAPLDNGTNQVECFYLERPGASSIGFGGRYNRDEQETLDDQEAGEVRMMTVEELAGRKIIP